MRKLRDKRLYWRGGRLWCRVPDASGRIVRRATGCRDEQAASDRANDFERQFADPSYAASASTTLDWSVKAYFADLVRRDRSEATKQIAQQKCGHMLRVWGREIPMSHITAQLVLDYVDQRQDEGASDFTIKKELGHLSQILILARHVGTFQLDPARVLPPFFSGKHVPKTRAPTMAEVESLLKELDDKRAAHLAFIAATGARLGESYRARRSDVRFDLGTVHIRGTKTTTSNAAVPISPVTEPLLRWALLNAPGSDVLFKPWGKLHRDVKAACVRAGIERLSPNDLRRSFGTWHRQRGIDANLVSKLLRHTTDKLAQTTYANIGAVDVGQLVRARLLPASETVPELYLTAGSNGVNETERADDASPDPLKKAESSSALGQDRTAGLRFRKPEAERRSRGTKLGLLRAQAAGDVPNLYQPHVLPANVDRTACPAGQDTVADTAAQALVDFVSDKIDLATQTVEAGDEGATYDHLLPAAKALDTGDVPDTHDKEDR